MAQMSNFEEEEQTLRMLATFERWLKLFDLLHDDKKLPPQSPWRRRGKKKLPLFGQDGDTLSIMSRSYIF